MKRSYSLLCLVTIGIVIIVLTACGSAPPAPAGTGPGSASPPPTQSPVQFIRVDYQGAAIGSEVPAWVEAAVNSDLEAIQRMSRFNGRVPIVDWGNGQNLDLLRSWVNNFNVQAGVSRRIVNYVEAEFGGEQLGDKDTPANRSLVDEIVATVSATQFSGLAREMDYWIKLRIVDRGRGTETEEYRYYVVYSMSETDLQYQVDQAMGRISAQNQDQQEIKDSVRDAMRRARFNSIQQSN